MMQSEFETLYGHEVSHDDYWDIIQPMYMATTLTKEDFVKCLDRKRFALPTRAELLKRMRTEVKHLHDVCGHYTDYESHERLQLLLDEFDNRFGAHSTWLAPEYEFPSLRRGCSYPRYLHIGELEVIDLYDSRH